MYEKRAILFMDILGFKKLVEDKKENLILGALEIPRDLQDRYPYDGSTGMEISAFSDSIVVSEIVKDDHIGIIRMVNYASYLWWKFFAKGVLVRGGIAFGDLYHKDSILFGPAMNEAYKLENELAIYPRIVVSEGIQQHLISELLSTYKGQGPMFSFGLQILRRDFDGVNHVHVLGEAGPAPSEINPPKEVNPITGGTSFNGGEICTSKRGFVEKFLVNRPSDLRVAAKYEWLASYLRATRVHG